MFTKLKFFKFKEIQWINKVILGKKRNNEQYFLQLKSFANKTLLKDLGASKRHPNFHFYDQSYDIGFCVLYLIVFHNLEGFVTYNVSMVW